MVFMCTQAVDYSAAVEFEGEVKLPLILTVSLRHCDVKHIAPPAPHPKKKQEPRQTDRHLITGTKT